MKGKDEMDPWLSILEVIIKQNMMMMQSLGAGYSLGNLREALTNRLFAPLFWNRGTAPDSFFFEGLD